jgi:hypothetical protein
MQEQQEDRLWTQWYEDSTMLCGENFNSGRIGFCSFHTTIDNYMMFRMPFH